jgi:RHS repeat-associated protein
VAIDEIAVMDNCDEGPLARKQPDTCSQSMTSKPQSSASKLLGDPVDLTNGSLRQTTTDIDLGGGLAFTRHYARDLSATGIHQGSLGNNWIHSLEWGLTRGDTGAGTGAGEAYVVGRPLATPHAFYRLMTQTTFHARAGTGSLALSGGNVVFTDLDGTQAVFSGSGSTWQLSTVTFPGQAPIIVSYTVDASGKPVTTYTRGISSLAVTLQGSASTDKIEKVSGGGESVSYGYTTVAYGQYSDVVLQMVTLPNRATLDPSDSIDITYEYLVGAVRGGVLNKVKRAGVTLSEWGWGSTAGAYRVTSIDEPTLDQPLACSYSRVVVENGANDFAQVTTTVAGQSSPSNILATFQSRTAGLPTQPETRVVAVTGSGGPGVPIPFAAGEAELVPGPNGPVETNRWHTQVDANGRTTLFENYQRDGAPGRIVEGWVDQDANDTFSTGDESTRLREFTYHPRLDAPQTVTQKSVMNPVANRVETSVYDPATDRLSARRLDGFTLDAAGAVVPFPTDETSFIYDSSGRLEQINGPRPQQHTEIDYDPTSGSRSALRRYLNGPGSTFLGWAFSNFDSRGNPQAVTDPNAHITTFTYDGLSRVLTATPPYEETGSTTITFTYDLDGNLTRVDFPPDSANSAVFLRLGYDAAKPSLLRFLADAQGNAIVYTYDKGRAKREERYIGFTDHASPGTRMGDANFSYDTAGRLFKAFNPLFAGDTVYTEFGHDAKGNPTSILDENGKQDELLYDALDRLEKIKQSRTAIYETEFQYDALSNVTSVTDAAAKTTDLLHDDRGNLVESLSPDTGRTRFLYDAAGNLTTKIENAPASGSAGGRITTYGYDGLNRLTSINLPNDPDWNFSYDTAGLANAKGRLASVTNGIVTTEFGYTQRGDVVYERMTLGGRHYLTGYHYDPAGNIKSIVTPDGTQISTSYAGLRPSAIAVGGATQTLRNIAWYPFGPWTHAAFPKYDVMSGQNTVVSERDVNLRGQVTRIHVTGAAGTVLDRSYAYDLQGNGTTQPDDPGPNLDEVIDARDGTESRHYLYDELDRLAKATNLAGTSVLHDYTYDAVGNRQTKSQAGANTTYHYESMAGVPINNRLASATGTEARAYAHDAYGNRVYDGTSPYAGTASMIYDDSNRLVTAKDPSNFGLRAWYVYDAFGRRVQKYDLVRSKVFLYFYDTAGHLIHEVEQKPNASDSNRTYVYLEDDLVGTVDRVEEAGTVALWPILSLRSLDLHAPGFGLILVVLGGGVLLLLARRHPAGATAATGAVLAVFTCAGLPRPPPIYSWVHTDPLGTPLAVTSAPEYPLSAVVWRAKYDPFGKATVDADPDADMNQFELNVRFPGQYEDVETGWYSNFYRTYDPNTGRYLEPDPIGQAGGLNLFAYAENDPVNMADAFGLLPAVCAGPSRIPPVCQKLSKLASKIPGKLRAFARAAVLACELALGGDAPDPPQKQIPPIERPAPKPPGVGPPPGAAPPPPSSQSPRSIQAVA